MPSSLKPGVTTQDHEVPPTRLEVEGSLPPWLEGQLLRTGPARFEMGGRQMRHWFDGFAAVDKFSFGDGEVAYTSKYLQTRALRAARETGRMPFYDYASDPCVSLFRKLFAWFSPTRCDVFTDNANVNVGMLDGHVVAMTETPIPVEFDPETLETLGVIPQDRATQGHHTTAHPHYTRRGEVINYRTRMTLPRPFYRIVRTSRGGRSEEVARVPITEPSYMHSFAMSERFVVLVEFPLVVSVFTLGLDRGPFIDAFRWKPERGTRIQIVDLERGALHRTAESEAIFGFHHINAFEENGTLAIDFAAYEDPTITSTLQLEHMCTDGAPIPKAYPTRLRVDLATGRTTQEPIGDACMELPRIAYERVNGRPYRYAYGTSTKDNSVYGYNDQLVKLAVDSGDTRFWSEPQTHPGEPVFVPAPGADGEDDGVILSVVLDSEREVSFLLVLDGETFEERARAEAPQRIPFGFHGCFVDA